MEGDSSKETVGSGRRQLEERSSPPQLDTAIMFHTMVEIMRDLRDGRKADAEWRELDIERRRHEAEAQRANLDQIGQI